MRVLVVSNVADTLAEILRIRGYDASAVYSAEEAHASCQEQSPVAVIIDMFMEPMSSSVQLAIRLAEALPTCKVILISRNVQKASRFLKGYQFPLLRRPKYPADILPFVAAVDAIVLP